MECNRPDSCCGCAEGSRYPETRVVKRVTAFLTALLGLAGVLIGFWLIIPQPVRDRFWTAITAQSSPSPSPSPSPRKPKKGGTNGQKVTSSPSPRYMPTPTPTPSCSPSPTPTSNPTDTRPEDQVRPRWVNPPSKSVSKDASVGYGGEFHEERRYEPKNDHEGQ